MVKEAILASNTYIRLRLISKNGNEIHVSSPSVRARKRFPSKETLPLYKHVNLLGVLLALEVLRRVIVYGINNVIWIGTFH